MLKQILQQETSENGIEGLHIILYEGKRTEERKERSKDESEKSHEITSYEMYVILHFFFHIYLELLKIYTY